MITLVGMWEYGWLEPKTELFMWRQLCAAFKVDRLVMVPILLENRTSVDQYETMQDALDSCTGIRVFLEPKGNITLKNFGHPKNAVYVFGKAGKNNQEFDGAKIRIDSPSKTDMFAISAAAIVLADRL